MSLIVQDFGGINNSDLAKSSARIIKGATWKKQRIAVIIPADEFIPAKVALSHWNLIFPPNQPVIKILAQGMEVGHAYSSAIESILAHPELSKWEFILTIEHDNCPPNDGLLKLITDMEARPELSAIGGLYFTKGVEYAVPQIWGDPNDGVLNFRPQPPRVGEIVECCGLGMGFTLFRLSLFKDARLRKPWFKTNASKDGVGTQDLFFWTDARQFGYRCAVDCTVAVGHYDSGTGICY